MNKKCIIVQKLIIHTLIYSKICMFIYCNDYNNSFLGGNVVVIYNKKTA